MYKTPEHVTGIRVLELPFCLHEKSQLRVADICMAFYTELRKHLCLFLLLI